MEKRSRESDMKIYYRATKPYLSRAFQRIEDGIKQTLPNGFELTSKQIEADLCICPIVSIKDAQNVPINSVIWQLCYLTAGGEESIWKSIWSDALLVLSYLDLPFEHYVRMPLGYDPMTFNTTGRNPESKYDVVVTGYVDEGQGGEVISRLCKHFGKVMHIGGNLRLRDTNYYNAEGISDSQLAQIYRSSRFVAGMRLKEGFELPIIEGAACGAKPIALDMECYRHWFEKIAVLIDPDNLDNDLSILSDVQWYGDHSELVKRFTWDKVMKKFWNTLMNGILK
jgi:glycosyltransferase involved in cell wall biosynthesis